MTSENMIRIGIAGLGTVGIGVVKILNRHQAVLAERSGVALNITAVSARDRSRDRGIETSGFRFEPDALVLAEAPDVDIVVELIGGADGVAYDLVKGALQNGKHVVTANKALLALHGTELAEIAEANNAAINFEAAIAGGIPIVKALREGLAGNRFNRVYGILNGTCNYILTEMEQTGRDFSDVLAEAQELGYAEADPSFDIDGVDAAHKLALLASLAYGARVDFSAVHIEGIRHIQAIDIAFAKELGYRIKLLAIAAERGEGIEQRVHCCMVPVDTPIAHVDGVFNAVVADGDFVDTTVFEGRGAGEGPTASAVVGDIIDIARGNRVPTFSVPVTSLRTIDTVSVASRIGRAYIRLHVVDRPGVIADIAAVLRDEAVSISTLVQRGRASGPNGGVPVVLITHEGVESALTRALERIAALQVVLETPRMIRIESF